MKKPKITEGEWVVSDFKPQVGVLKYGGLAIKPVCKFDIEMDWMDDPDMNAISAVPEMMQDLYDWYVNMKDFDEDDVFKNFGGFERTTFDELMESTRKTLVKAGCEL